MEKFEEPIAYFLEWNDVFLWYIRHVRSTSIAAHYDSQLESAELSG